MRAVSDDGLWFFKHTSSAIEVQLESSYGMIPFLAETDRNDERVYVFTVPAALGAIESLLGIAPQN